MSKYTIGDKVKVTLRYRGNTNKKEGKIIDVFPAFKVPPKKKVLKYYGENAMNTKFARIFGPWDQARIVVRVKKGDYLILPFHGINRYFALTHIRR